MRHAICCVETECDPVVVNDKSSHLPFMNEINNSTRVFATMGSNLKQIKVYDAIELARNWTFLYVFTGRDTVSSMYNCSKTHFCEELFKQPNIPQLLEVFAELSNQPMAVSSEHVDILEKFLVKVYYPKSVNTNSLTDERAGHFKGQASVNIRQLPLSRPGLIEHIKRACMLCM